MAWPTPSNSSATHLAQTTVIDEHLEPVGAAVGEHVGAVGLRAEREAAHHPRQQLVDTAAQIARTQRQPDSVDADHRPISLSSTPSSRACVSGQCRSSRAAPAPAPPTFNSMRTVAAVAAGLAATRAATKPLDADAAARSTLTPSSRACQRRACPHQLPSVPNSTPLAWAHALAFCPEARYASTCAKQRSISCRSMLTSSRSLIAQMRDSQLHRTDERWVGGTLAVELRACGLDMGFGQE